MLLAVALGHSVAELLQQKLFASKIFLYEENHEKVV